MSPQLSETALRECGRTARTEYGPDLHGLCREACELVGNCLIDTGLPPARDVYTIRHVRVGPCGEERHYILTVPGQYVEGVPSTESVYIDPTVTQFCDENAARGRVDVSLGARDTLPDVVVSTPGDDWRSVYKAPSACRGPALTPETLTLAHKQEATELLDQILNEAATDVSRTFQTSARTQLRLTDQQPDGFGSPDVELRLTTAKSALPTPLQGDTPDRMDNHLRGIHDDLRAVLDTLEPPRCSFTIEWTPTRVTRTDREFTATIRRQ